MNQITPRPYQQITVDKVINALNQGNNALIQLPTGSGKSIILSLIIKQLSEIIPNFRAIVCVDREILVSQLTETIHDVNPDIIVSHACAGVSKKVDMTGSIVIGTRQTISNTLDINHQSFHLLIFDEAHLLRLPSSNPEESQGQFYNIVKHMQELNPRVRLFGCSASCYSLQAGYIYGKAHKPDLIPYFERLCHKVTYKELTDNGFLVPLKGKIADSGADLSKIDTTAGDYNLKQLTAAMGQHTKTIVQAVNDLAADRKSILIFCCDTDHVEKVYDAFDNPHACVKIHSKMKKDDRFEQLERFKTGKARIAISINILAIGFDHKPVDCIILARPTMSTSLCIQQIGRGLRPAPDTEKKDCLLIDITDNVTTHFPQFDLDRPNIVIPRKSGPKGEPCPWKICPECDSEVHASSMFCPNCNYEFRKDTIPAEFLPDLRSVSFDESPPPEPYPMLCINMDISVHEAKKAGPEGPRFLMKIKFDLALTETSLDLESVYEWLCFADHYSGYAVTMGQKKWGQYTSEPCPDNVTEAVWIAETAFKRPEKVMVIEDGKYLKIDSLIFPEEIETEQPKPISDFINENQPNNQYDDEIPF